MKANEFKLYQSSGSPNSRRVRIFLAEKGICMPMVPVDLGADACCFFLPEVDRDESLKLPEV